MSKVEYDDIAKDYKESKALPFRDYIETYTIFQMAGDVQGKKIFDFACGEGFYTRKFKKAGASDIIGMDLSSEMIKLAQDSEDKEPIGCKYLVGDASKADKLGDFDMVIAMYLLNYASTKELISKFCQSAFKQLKSGGRFIGFNDNILEDKAYYPTYQKYGFIKKTSDERNEGDAITYVFKKDDGSTFEFNNFYLKPETYAQAFRDAGFINFQWETPLLEPSQKGNVYWKEFMEHPPIIGFSAEKA
jgi:ubiquinone/menaquinone biosynthesis C-methylase UbiE